MLTKRFRLSLPAEGENLALIRKLIEKFVEDTAFKRRLFEIKVVISEASSNVIRHAYDKKAASSLITVHGHLNPFFLRISVKDTGKGLMSLKKNREYPEDGGYGIEVMRKLSDRFMYKAAPGLGTTVDVLFYRPLAPMVLKTPKIALVAAAASILVLGAVWSTALSSPPGSPLYIVREMSEDLFLKVPMRDVDRADLAIGFVEDHLDDYERLKGNGRIDLLNEAIEDAFRHVAVLDRELRGVSAADRERLKGKIRKLNKRAVELSRASAGPKSRGPDFLNSGRKPPRSVSEIANATSKILAERAMGGERI